jgi:hypothetical protein
MMSVSRLASPVPGRAQRAINGGEDRTLETVKPMPGVGNAGSVRRGPLAWVNGP